MNIVRILLSLAANFLVGVYNNLMLKMLFLHGNVEEEVFMEPPHEFDKMFGTNKECRLKNTLYGLNQSPKAWFERFTRAILTMGYKQSQVDNTLCIKHSTIGGRRPFSYMFMTSL